jgi:hypothetical protein
MTFVCREGNGAAYALSKVATENVMIKRWLNEQPERISEIVTMERIAPYVLI